MKNNYIDDGIRERLIISGIKEIENHGLNDFSLRRVASACDVSCAAPYRHYKNKDELILEIIRYINSRFALIANQAMAAYKDDAAKQITELAVMSVRFLVGNGNYTSVILPIGCGMTEEQKSERKKFFDILEELVKRQKGNADSEKMLYIVKTYIYGTVLELCEADEETCEKRIATMREELMKIIKNNVE